MEQVENATVFYSIKYRPFDGSGLAEDLLCRVRRNYFDGRGRQHGADKESLSGLSERTRYHMKKNIFQWERRQGGKVVEYAMREPYGYSITTLGADGEPVRRARFSKEHQWLQTAYFGLGQRQAEVVLQPEMDGISMLKREESGRYSKSALVPVPYEPGTTAQSLVNAAAGEPDVLAVTERGSYCYCSAEEASLRKNARDNPAPMAAFQVRGGGLEDFQPINNVPEPEVELVKEPALAIAQALVAPRDPEPVKPPDEPDYAVYRTVSFVEEEPPQEAAEVPVIKVSGPECILVDGFAAEAALRGLVEASPANVPVQDAGPEAVRFLEEPETKAEAAQETPPSRNVAEKEFQSAPTEREFPYLVTEPFVQQDEALPQPSPKTVEPPIPEPVLEQALILQEEPKQDLKPVTIPPTPPQEPQDGRKYAVAAKNLAGNVVSVLTAPREGASVLEGVRPASRIVVSAEESYLYFGNVINGLREGRGRTAQEAGDTVYEGGYKADKRDGFGTYYYKSGKLCYAGSWKMNRREGAGVAFSAKDGSLFAGKWKDNIPTGLGAAFDAQGNLLYIGEWKDGKRHGEGTEYHDGHPVYVGGWENDQRTVGWAASGGGDAPPVRNDIQ